MRTLITALLLSAASVRAADIPVGLDPRLETMGIVQMLAGGEAPHGFRVPEGEYAQRAATAFARLRKHPAVALTAALSKEFDYRNRTDAVLRRGPLPDMAPRWFTPDYMVDQAGGREKFEAWIAALADFARQAHIQDFLRDNASALEPGVSQFKADLARRGYLEKLERYAGYSLRGRYEVYLSPFILRGGQENAVLRLDDGSYQIISVRGPDFSGGRLTFWPEEFVATAGHEIAHGLLDTLGDLHREKIARMSGTYKKLPWPCYNDWLQCAKENAVRAVMLRLIASESGEDAASRHLDEEGRAKYPYLEEMTKRLREYEADRKRWPNLAAFYPTLIGVFPQDSPVVPGPAAPSAGGPGPEWVYEETKPFSTPGQRALALEYLDRALAASRDPLLLRRRAAFRLLQGDAVGAEADASAAVKLDPSDPAALLARGLARARSGRAEEARADYDAALAACAVRGSAAEVACANARRMADGGVAPATFESDPNVGPNPELGANPALTPPPLKPAEAPTTAGRAPAVAAPPKKAVRPAGAGADYKFVVDPRVELLAAVASLARPAKGGGRPEFEALKDQPAVKRWAAALDRGVTEAAGTQLLLSAGEPPNLAERGPVSAGLAAPIGGENEAEGFLAELRDFARAADWTKVWKSRAAANAAMVARAQAETSRTLSPEAVEAWFGTSFKDRYRFLLSDDLPAAYGANTSVEEDGRRVEIRLRSTMGWKDKNAYFSFDDFAGSVAHELTHTLTDPIILARQKELVVYASLMVPGCTDSWTGCVLEHVNIAATLRALRAESGEEAYRKTLKDYAGRGFPYLPALCERLAEFEAPAVRAKGFAAFFPRVEDVFREALRGKFKAQAQSNVAASAAAAAPAKEPFSEEFGSDPRLELAAVLHRLAASPEKRAKEAAAAPDYAARLDARFLAYSTQPAVALTAKLEGAEGTPGLPAILIVHLSTGPELAQKVAVPSGYIAAAGGDEALSAWSAASRKFAKETGFFAFYASEAPYYASLKKEASDESARALSPAAVSAYVGRPLQGKRAYALSPLYPASFPARLTVYGGRGAQVLRARAARADAKGTARFDLDSDKTSTAAELIYDEAVRLIPGAAPAAASLSGTCSDRRGPGWPVCEREHLVAALRLRVRRAAPETPEDGVVPALPYMPGLLDQLSSYETHRATYPALSDFWPEAEKAFGPRKGPTAMSEADLASYAEFAVDPRVELISVLLRLGGAEREKGDKRNELEKLADQRFASFAAHAAVARARALSRGGAAPGQVPLRLALALDDPPELTERGLPPEPWLSAAGGPAGFRAFAASLRSFAKEARFASYYDAARPLYKGFVAEARAEALREENPRAAQAYLGAELPKAHFLLSALLPETDGADFDLHEGAAAVRTFVWPAAQQPGPARFRFDAFGDSVAHELIHAVTDPLVPEHFTARGAVPKGCNDAGGAGTWRACAQEHLVYAVTLRLLAADAGEEAARIQTAAYAERGYPRLTELTEKLKAYEQSRARWPKLAAYAPELLDVLSSAAEERAAAKQSEAQKLMEKGVAAFLAGDMPAATSVLRSAQELSPEDAEIALNLGVCLGKSGDTAGEAAAYDRAIKLGLSEKSRQWEIAAAALSSRAELALNQGRREPARTDLERALSIVPADWSGRGGLVKRLEDLKK
jgi:Flp pilus assembly protein TadD